MQSIPRALRYLPRTAATLLIGLAGCASSPPPSPSAWHAELLQHPPHILLLGEQHDAPEHQQWQRQTVAQWAASGQLAAVVLEMADAEHSTQAVDKSVDESAVQQALAWNDKAWPWQAYGPVVMAAVRAGVPVLGGNLPRAQMKQTMGESRYDSHLPADGWQAQLDAIKEGHCGLLPESQFAPMARIQLARDESMAKVTAAAVQQQTQPDQAVLLVAGRGHVRSDVGVPTWLPKEFKQKVAIAQSDKAQAAINIKADKLLTLTGNASKDQCAELREQWKSRPAPKPAAS